MTYCNISLFLENIFLFNLISWWGGYWSEKGSHLYKYTCLLVANILDSETLLQGQSWIFSYPLDPSQIYLFQFYFLPHFSTEYTCRVLEHLNINTCTKNVSSGDRKRWESNKSNPWNSDENNLVWKVCWWIQIKIKIHHVKDVKMWLWNKRYHRLCIISIHQSDKYI